MVSGFPDASDVNTLVFYPGYKTYNVDRAFVFTIETPWVPVKANKWVVGSFCVASGGGKSLVAFSHFNLRPNCHLICTTTGKFFSESE